MSLTRLAVLVSTALIGFGLPLPAGAAPLLPLGSKPDSPSAVSWLRKAAAAPNQVSYHGTQIITAWGPQGASSAMFNIVHAASQGSEISVVGSSAPGAKAFVQRATTTGAAIDGGPLALLQSTYQLVDKCCTDLIGRPAVQVEALRDDQTLAARFWIDKATGLLLQRQLFSADGKTMVRATVFTELEIESSEFLGHLPPMLPSGVESVGLGKVDKLRSQGWVCAPDLPASLTLYDVHQDTSNGSLQFSYSDGLFNVSLFEQRGALDPAAVAGFSTTDSPGVYVRYGMPSYVVWSSGGIVYTLIGDLPAEQLGQVVRAFPHEQPIQLTAIQRLGTGLAKIATWLTPMGALSPKLG
ncbi:sigma-E factor regulatory protein RseB domain-containing protein [Kribbella solani]|uniref:sigma-E factor regulatory protein RseB domain-containing protein n=1 Tax=Kribbella solani TaxID=236067 RepID=UPI0029BF75C4|nr:sigma-E factor regulatory protein RseB domain-containing protein [Kribbella solani]MDX2973750.1 sigma-E factor regulatory protein RseB domain-containing protein [Kribbella solani]MDX3002850.1 sigma-E factor regulatory protein RseB domain-containing protein [Kribbella solani]